MSANPNLVALLNAINTNSLTVGMQGALAQALALIIPNFPTPDELSSALPPPDEDDAREWIAALYSIQATGGGGGGSVVNAAFTPNTETSFGPITPGGSPVDLAVADITPTGTGLLQIVATFAFATSVPDAANLALFAVAPLTSIVGGTLVGNGITADPTSTAPAPSGTPIMSVVAVESTVGGDIASMTITGTYQAVPGQRTGIVVQGLSAVGGATTWVVGFTMSVVELASGGVGGGSVTNVSAAANSGLVVANPTTTPVVGPQPGFSPASLTFLNNAALAAFSAATPTALVQGQRAVVLSNGGVWTFKLVSALTPGNTVINAAGVAGAQWVRDGQTNIPNALKQTAWFVDPQNVSGTASDENDGLTSATALINKREIFRRWGWTWTPNLVGPLNVLITYLSSNTDATDPGLFAPNFVNGATLKHVGVLPAASFTGTLLAVTAKNRTANTPLRSTFTTTTGAMAANLMLVNATRGNSVAFAQRISGGSTWQITQPFAPYVGLVYPTATEVDTWANGDSISGFALLSVDLAAIGGITAGIQPAFVGPSHFAQHLNVADPQGLFNLCTLSGTAAAVISECVITRLPTYGAGGGAQYLTNCAVPNGVLGTSQVDSGTPLVQGGYLAGGIFLANASLQADTIVASAGQFTSCTLGNVFYEGGTQIFTGATTVTGAQYGSVAFNVQQGSCNYGQVGTAVAAFPISGGLQCAGAATAYGTLNAAGNVTLFKRALSPAALDAAAGLATGFGGLASVPGVASFQNVAAQP